MDKGIFHCVVDLSMNHLYRFRHQVGTDMEDVVHEVVPAKKRLAWSSAALGTYLVSWQYLSKQCFLFFFFIE